MDTNELRRRFSNALGLGVPVALLACSGPSAQPAAPNQEVSIAGPAEPKAAGKSDKSSSRDDETLPARRWRTVLDWQPEEPGAGCTVGREVAKPYADNQFGSCPTRLHPESSGVDNTRIHPRPPQLGPDDYAYLDRPLTERAREAGMSGACCYRREDFAIYEGRPLRDGDRLVVEARTLPLQEAARLAREEHASSAAFCRVLLELLAHGAPASLLADVLHAVRDELRHAEVWSQVFGTPPLACDELPVNAQLLGLQGRQLQDLIAETFRDGCVGEAWAALRAAERARCQPMPPEARAALDVLAADEVRHAELAWRTLAWSTRLSSERGRVAREVVRRETSTLRQLAHQELPPLLGQLLTQAVLPCAEALRRSWQIAA